MRSIKSIFLTVLIFIPCLLIAQQQGRRERKTSFNVSTDILQYFNDTYRIDIEGKKTNASLSHFLTIEYLNGKTNNHTAWLFHEDTDPITGFGVGIHQKWVAKKGNNKSTPYLAYGIGLRKVSINYSEVGFSRYTENSLDYYTYGPFNDELKIKSGMANVIGGIQFLHSTNIIFDGYLGVVYKISDTASNQRGPREYNKSSSSFAYEGLAFQLGAKVGFKIH